MNVWRHAQTIASLAVPVALPVERIEGSLHGTAERVVLTYAGAPPGARFIERALIEVERRTSVGRLSSPAQLRGEQFRRMCAGSQVAAMEVPRAWQACLPPDTQVRMPAWVSQQIHAADGSALVPPPRVLKEARRHSRREHYELRLTRDASDVRRFHATLYLPYVTRRFGGGAVVVDSDRFQAVARDMTLAILSSRGDWVAGMLLARRGDTLELGWFGASQVPPRAGASEVLDAGVLEWAAAEGVRRVIMGHSRPSLADGVVRYKSRFGAVVRETRFPQRVLGLWILRWSPALVAGMNAAQFVTFQDGEPAVYRAQPGAQAA